MTASLIGGPGESADAGEDTAGVAALFHAHHLELVRLALVMVGDLAAAEDVVQDAFESLHHRWHRLRDTGSALAYARSTVLNRCRSLHRRAAVARRYTALLAAGAGQTVPVRARPGRADQGHAGPRLAGSGPAGSGLTGGTQPDAAEAIADRNELVLALRALPRRQREVLVLRYYLDLDIAEIAETLRISPSAVRSTNTRGLAALGRALRPPVPAPGDGPRASSGGPRAPGDGSRAPGRDDR